MPDEELRDWVRYHPLDVEAFHTLMDRLDQILEKGGELIWHADPVKKGSNLCHGTSGNGYAFLKLFKRTGNELWLDRASFP